MKKALDLQKGKWISTNSLIELAEYVLKNNIFEHNPSFYKQLRGTENGRKIPPLYAVIFGGDFEEILFSDCDILPLILWRYGEKVVKKSLRTF